MSQTQFKHGTACLRTSLRVICAMIDNIPEQKSQIFDNISDMMILLPIVRQK
jgi:hypothetical protein